MISSEDPIYYLGVVEVHLTENEVATTSSKKAPASPAILNEWNRSLEEQTIDQIDSAQIVATLPRRFVNQNTEQRVINVSTLAIKFIDFKSKKCVERLAMHKIIQYLSYDAEVDQLTNMVILEQAGKSNRAKAHVFQTDNNAVNEELSRKISGAFNELDNEAFMRAEEQKKKDQEKREQRNQLKRVKSSGLPPIPPNT